MSKRFIEYDLPLAEISEESAREKNIRHGHPSTLHIWWARRPLASSRATAFAALIDDPGPDHPQERDEIRKLIKEMSPWEAVKDGNSPAIRRAREMILRQYGRPPRVLDPFAGGGSIPLEALRLGCETYSGDINALAYLIGLGTLVYPQVYGQPILQPEDAKSSVQLVKSISEWGDWVLARTEEQVGQLYQDPVNGEPVTGYLWARTVRCPNPVCEAQVPLISDWWVSRRDRRRIALKPVADREAHRLAFDVTQVGTAKSPGPDVGTFRRGRTTCPFCGQSFDTWRQIGLEHRLEDTPLVVITHQAKRTKYRPFTEQDKELFARARDSLKSVDTSVLDQPLSGPDATNRLSRFGFRLWRDLFNERQLLVLATLAQQIRMAHHMMLTQQVPPDRAKAVASYLALALSQIANANSCLAAWMPTTERSLPASALPGLWMPGRYHEGNPLVDQAGGWPNAVSKVCSAVKHTSSVSATPAVVQRGTATHLPYPDSCFEAVVTDPPYYNAVLYSELARFYEVWLDQAIGSLYPGVFAAVDGSTETLEQYGTANQDADSSETEAEDFLRLLEGALSEINRVLVPSGILVLLFPYRSLVGLDPMIASLAHARFVISACWPIQMERHSLGASLGKNLLDVVMTLIVVCRKRTGETQGREFAHFRAQVRRSARENLARHQIEHLAGLVPDLLSQLLVEISQSYPILQETGEPVSMSEIWDIVQDEIGDMLTVQELVKDDPSQRNQPHGS